MKPSRPQKKKAVNGTTKKRSATDVCDLPAPKANRAKLGS